MSKAKSPAKGAIGSGSSRGRPRIGDAKTIRLPNADIEFAIHAGGGNLSEGVRLGVNAFRALGKPLDLTDSEQAYAAAVGGGFVADGLLELLRAQQALVPYEELTPRRGKRLLPPPDPFLKVLDAASYALAKKLGGGDVAEGVRMAMRASMVMGEETIRRLGDGPASTSGAKPVGK
jgi:hypothetical protein